MTILKYNDYGVVNVNKNLPLGSEKLKLIILTRSNFTWVHTSLKEKGIIISHQLLCTFHSR